MKICNNGITRDMTAEEIAAWQRSIVGLAPTATDAELAAAQVAVQAKEAAKEAAEAAKITKRPKRSEINAVMAGIDGAETVGQLRIEVKKLASMMVNVLEIQSVPVVEDQL